MSLLACDAAWVGILDSRREQTTRDQALPEDPDDGDDAAAFFRHYWDCDSCSYPDRSGDLNSVTKRSDFYSFRQYRSTGMWAEYLAPVGYREELLVRLAGVPGGTLRLVLFRSSRTDFTEQNRTMLWLLRPHLQALHGHRASLTSGRATLTPRQAELLELVAAGHTNQQIGRILGISESTSNSHVASPA